MTDTPAYPSRAKEYRQAYDKEYVQRDYVMAASRERSLRKSKEKKVLTTKKRFEEHSVNELMWIAQERCREQGIDFDEKKALMLEAISILHGQDII
jgi:hypothetical protein